MVPAMTMHSKETRLARAITRVLNTAAPAARCPELEEIAALADDALPEGARERLLAHFSECGRCREIFVATRELTAQEQAAGSGRRYLFPWALAAAAVLVLALGLTLKKGTAPEARIAEIEQAPPQRPARSEKEGVQVATAAVDPSGKREAPLSAVPRVAPGVARRTPPLTVEATARELFKRGDPRRLAELTGVQDKSYGFAGPGNRDRLAFRVGITSMDLEVALLADDGDRAQAQAARLCLLLQTLIGEEETAGLERLVARLEKGEKPSGFAGSIRGVERLIPPERLGYARLGARVQAARLAARSGNRAYFEGRTSRDLAVRPVGLKLPPRARGVLGALSRKMRDPQGMDLALVDADLEELVQGL